MKSKKILSLTLTLLLISPITTYAKGNEKSEQQVKEKAPVVQQEKKSEILTKQEDSKTIIESKAKVESTTAVENKAKPEKIPGTSTEDLKGKAGEKKVQAEAPKEKTNEKKPQTVVSTEKEKANEKKAQAEAQREEKALEKETFKSAIRAKHTEMKAIKTETIAIKKEIEAKREQLAEIMNQLISGEKTLSEEMLDSLLDVAQNLQLDVEEVQETAEVTDEASEVEESVVKSDFNSAIASLDKVIIKLQQRLDALKLLNEDLDKALEISNMSETPSSEVPTEVEPATPTETDSTESTDTTLPAETDPVVPTDTVDSQPSDTGDQTDESNEVSVDPNSTTISDLPASDTENVSGAPEASNLTNQ
jgi:hypothetical protein